MSVDLGVSTAAPLDRLGIEIGHYTDVIAKTGLTVFLLKQGVRSASTFPVVIQERSIRQVLASPLPVRQFTGLCLRGAVPTA